MAVCFISGQGADSTGGGRVMWARVKGQVENELLSRSLPSYIFRPGVVQPLKGVRSNTKWYQVVYFLLTPLFPVLRRFFPNSVTTTEHIGRAMIRVTSTEHPQSVLETRDINALGAESP